MNCNLKLVILFVTAAAFSLSAFSQDDYLQRMPLIAAHKYFSKLAEEMADTQVAAQESEPVKKLVKELGAEDFKTRENATAELIQFGPSIKAELVSASKNKDPETAFRIKKVLAAFRAAEGEKPKLRFEQYIFNNHVTSYVKAKDKQLIPMLIAFLGHPNQQVKFCAWQHLSKLTGQELTDSDIGKWEKWWKENRDTFKFKETQQPAQDAPEHEMLNLQRLFR